MKQRKLFQAKDEHGNLHYIDSLDSKKKKNQDFFCPHCNEKVIPKMGSKNVWHFSHVDKPCSMMRQSAETDGIKQDKDIWSYTKKFKVGSDFKINPGSCQCEFCKIILPKEDSVKWSDEVFICRDCYRQLNREKIDHLQWKSIL